MPRQKGSKDLTKRKSRKVPTSNGEVEMSHNNPPLTDDQQAVLLIQGVQKIEDLLERSAEIVSSIRILRKQLKADGFEKPVVDYALYLRKTEPEKAQELHRQQLKVAKWLAHPIGTQATFDMFQPFDQYFADGKAAGMAGEACDTVKLGLIPSDPSAQRWMEGWHAGQAALMGNIKQVQSEQPFDPLEEIPFE